MNSHTEDFQFFKDEFINYSKSAFAINKARGMLTGINTTGVAANQLSVPKPGEPQLEINNSNYLRHSGL